MGLKKIYIKVKIEGKNIINNFWNDSLKVLRLFLKIKTTAINGKNSTNCSQIKQTKGAIKKTWLLIIDL